MKMQEIEVEKIPELIHDAIKALHDQNQVTNRARIGLLLSYLNRFHKRAEGNWVLKANAIINPARYGKYLQNLDPIIQAEPSEVSQGVNEIAEITETEQEPEIKKRGRKKSRRNLLRVIVEIKSGNKKITEIDFPLYPHEVSLSHFVDYQVAFDDLMKWREETDSQNFNNPKRRAQELQKMAACVSAFIGQDVSGVSVGSVLTSGMSIENKEVTMTGLFNAIAMTLSRYKKNDLDSDYWFDYKGVRYKLPSMYRDAITRQERFAGVSTGQAVEVLDKWGIYQDNLEKGVIDPNYTFSVILLIIATFAQADGDVFPDNDTDIEKFISDRVIHFKDVDMQVALDVFNFFSLVQSPRNKSSVPIFLQAAEKTAA